MVRFSFAKCSWRPRKVTSVARRVWADIFFSDYFRIGVGSWRPSLHCALRFCRFWQNSLGFCRIIFGGKRSFWWCWMVTCKGCFICEEHQSWESFCVAGTMFGDVAGWPLMLCAFYWAFHVSGMLSLSVVVAVCFASQRLPAAMYSSFHSCAHCDHQTNS